MRNADNKPSTIFTVLQKIDKAPFFVVKYGQFNQYNRKAIVQGYIGWTLTIR